jgi:RNA ligase (TIGR02306 family)
LPAELQGLAKGLFPSFIRRTDQERAQNMIDEIFVANANAVYEITLKLDGTSVTFYYRDGENGVCSRNLELKIEGNETNSLVKMYTESGIAAALPQLGDVAIQGELMGPGIQGNREGLTHNVYFIFEAQNLAIGRNYTPDERDALFARLMELGVDPKLVKHVPIVAHRAQLFDTLGIKDIEGLLKFADGKSLVHAIREGLVYKRIDGGFSFKTISNRFLIKEQ